ncbi:hypothetical protein [Rhodobaculum claviforme]|uniref:Uncharacterized protein n=1 Tax=Rhodobaculum claviforme TaxID=1549854 RepID=A0A934WK29_9RHOB|nr:hypothetical protein [Rhodobaculum claviforme]MBK5928439.1 hypothetical protein [Rhodobaculum claviforme]
MTRSIVLHPGLPKCATSTLQRLFVMEDHALARALGVAVLGKGFVPMNGPPPVTELMYAPEDCLRALRAQDYPPGQYFLSSEALASQPDFIAEIAQLFTVSRMVVTVRFPPAQALSNFRYSGWLTQDLHGALADRATGPLHALQRHARKLAQLSALAETLACPVEGAGLAERFCLTCFAQTPARLGDAPFATLRPANESIGLGFATALREALVAQGLTVTGADRARLVKLAQRRRLPPDVAGLMPEGFAPADLAPALDALEGYGALLRDHGVAAADTATAVAAAEAQFRALLARPGATRPQMATLRRHAGAVVRAATDPDADTGPPQRSRV